MFHILRGGLNFGLREALGDAFNWKRHASCFISAQRERVAPGSDQWRIIEDSYRKFQSQDARSIVLGDVVATGTSLDHGFSIILDFVKRQGGKLSSLLFFTIGGPRTIEIVSKYDELLRACCPDYTSSTVVFFEGIFSVPDQNTPLRIKIDGTDLLRSPALLSPEFFESQYEHPAYPLERCTIYDAGSRAFDIREYAKDLDEYWRGVHSLVESGVTFVELLGERLPECDQNKFNNTELRSVVQERLDQISALCSG